MTLDSVPAIAGAIGALALSILIWYILILKARGRNAPPPSPSPSAPHPQPATFSPTTPPPSRAPSSPAPPNLNEHSSLLIDEGWTAWNNDGLRPTNQEHHEPSQQSPTPSSSTLPSPPFPSSPPNSDEPSNLQSDEFWAPRSHGRPTNREYHETNQVSLNIHDEDFSPHQEERHSAEGQIVEGSPYMLGVGDETHVQPEHDGADDLAMEMHLPPYSSSPQRSSSFDESAPGLVSDHGSSDLVNHHDPFNQGLRTSKSKLNRAHNCAESPCASCADRCISTVPHTRKASVGEPPTPPDPTEDPRRFANLWDGTMPSTHDAIVPYESIESPLPRVDYPSEARNGAGLDISNLASALAGINPRADDDMEGRAMSEASTQVDLEGSPDIRLPLPDLSEASGSHEPLFTPNHQRNASGPWHPPLCIPISDSRAEIYEVSRSENDEENQRQKQKLQSIARQQGNLEDTNQGRASTNLFAVRRGILTPTYTVASSSVSSPGRGSNIPNPPERSPEARVPEGPQRVIADPRLSQLSTSSHPIRIPSPGLGTSGLAVEAERPEITPSTARAGDRKNGNRNATKPDTPPSSKSDTPPSTQEGSNGNCHSTAL